MRKRVLHIIKIAYAPPEIDAFIMMNSARIDKKRTPEKGVLIAFNIDPG